MSGPSGRDIIACPFCGSANILVESDDVKIAQIKADANKDIAFETLRSTEAIERGKQANNANIAFKQLETKRQIERDNRKAELEKTHRQGCAYQFGQMLKYVGVVILIVIMSIYFLGFLLFDSIRSLFQ